MQMSSQLRLLSPEIVASIKARGAVSEVGDSGYFCSIYLKFLSVGLCVLIDFIDDCGLKAAHYRLKRIMHSRCTDKPACHLYVHY